MAFTLSQIVTNRRDTSVEAFGETIHFTYKPALITREAIDRLTGSEVIDVDELQDETKLKEALAKAGQSQVNLYEFLAEAIVSWDIKENPKKKLPVTTAGISKLPLAVVGLIYSKMLSDAREAVSESGK